MIKVTRLASLSLAMVIATSVLTPALAIEDDETVINSYSQVEDFVNVDGSVYVFNPADGEHYPMVDKTAEFQQMSEEEVQTFGATDTSRRSIGPVAFGIEYKDWNTFDFSTGSSIQYDMFVPEKIGGTNVTDETINLTATNLAVMADEVMMQYVGQNPGRLRIFDRSMQRFVLSIPYSNLTDYLREHPDYGNYLSVKNVCMETAAEEWGNFVYLFNKNTSTYDLIYWTTYDATLILQMPALNNPYCPMEFWGPSIEVSRDSYGWLLRINHIGFDNTFIGRKNTNFDIPLWDHTDLLNYMNSTRRMDHAGMGTSTDFFHSNYGFVVH